MTEPTEEPQSIRLARPQEYAAIAAIHLPAWKKAYQAQIKPECLARYDVSAFAGEYHNLVARGHTITRAMIGDDVGGVAIFHPTLGKIEALYVDKDRWNAHIGTRLLYYALDAIKTDDVVLDCAQGNESGCRFWENRGFVRAGIGEPFDPVCDASVPTWRYLLRRTTTTMAEPQQSWPSTS